MKKLNLTVVQEALYRNPSVRRRIERDYSISVVTSGPSQFCKEVIKSLQQIPSRDPRHEQRTNDDVFEAAARAIGSNSRSWARYLKNESELRCALCDFNVQMIDQSHGSLAFRQEAVRALLGGITAKNDSRAIIGWITVLQRTPNYYAKVLRLAGTIDEVATNLANKKLQVPELMVCIVAALAKPSHVKNPRILESLDRFGSDPKLKGMGYVLGSEFFRNLGWSGFKPDRHIKRLLDRWSIVDTPDIQQRVQLLADVLGSTDQEFHEFASYSLRGVSLTPSDCSYSVADNHIWLLGAYVEKKNRETSTTYIDFETSHFRQPSTGLSTSEYL